MKLGLGSFAYAWAIGVPGFPPPRPMSAIDLVERAAELGVHVVQIGDNLPLHTLQPAQLRALEAAAQACRVDIEVGTRGIAPEHLERYLDLATRFSSRVLRVVVDTPDHRPSEGEVLSTLKPLLPSFEAQGVVLAIENHDRFAATTLARLITELNSPAVGICLDTANSLGALEGTKEVVATLAPFTVNLHVKDVIVRRSNETMGFVVEGRPAGDGMIDIPWLLQQVGSSGREHNVILELWPPKRSSLAESIATEDAWARTSVTYLRRLIAS